MKALFVPLSVLAISACAPTVLLDKYNSDIATANAEISMATGIVQSFSANATVIAARLYAAEACVEAMASTAQMDCETALSASTSTPTPRSSLAPLSASTSTPTPRSSLAPLSASTSTPTPSLLATSSLAPLATPAPASPSDGQRTYSDPEYGFSISYPAHLDIVVSERVPSLFLGEQIHVAITDVDPLKCRGDCLLVESTNPATVAGLDAIRVAGYMGAIGGEIPQRYLQYILQHDDRYYVFTLFALGFHASSNDFYTIWPLEEDDVTLFEQVLETLKFTN